MPSQTPQVKVCIWMPRAGFSHFMGIGHAALKITTNAGMRYYITWLGEKGGMFDDAADALGFETRRNPRTNEIENNPTALGSGKSRTYRDDKIGLGPKFAGSSPNNKREVFKIKGGFRQIEIVPATWKISIPVRQIPATQASDNLFGLDVERIEEWWRRLMALPPGDAERRYHLLSTSKNCCAVTRRALEVGGLGCYAQAPFRLDDGSPHDGLYQGAKSLLRWVEKAAARIEALNNDREKVMPLVQGSSDRVPDTIPTLEEWKRDSYVGTFARRKEQVAAIDELLPQYHRAKDADERMHLLCDLMQYAVAHLLSKPKSDRRQAMIRLTRRILAAINKDRVQQFVALFENVPSRDRFYDSPRSRGSLVQSEVASGYGTPRFSQSE